LALVVMAAPLHQEQQVLILSLVPLQQQVAVLVVVQHLVLAVALVVQVVALQALIAD
jgi:hypothetical protein